jgi:hypothetical protein
VVAPACNSSTWEAEAGESRLGSSLGYIVRPHLKKIKEEKNKTQMKYHLTLIRMATIPPQRKN